MSDKSSDNESGESSDEELREQGKGKDQIERKLLKWIICSKQYKNIRTWKQHIQSHIGKRKCDFCDKSFTRSGYLSIHQANVHGILKEKKRKITSFTCKICKKTFDRKYNLTRHTDRVHQRGTAQQSKTQFSCRHYDCEFDDYDGLFDHVNRNHPLKK